MKKTLLVVALLLVAPQAQAFDVILFGVNVNKLENRNLLEIGVGAAASLLVHEAGHFAVAKINGSSATFRVTSVTAHNTENWSHEEHQMFARGGFLAQLFVGSILTIIPQTSHNDFTIGFNGFTAVNTCKYTLVNYEGKGSDIGYLKNGKSEGGVYTITANLLLHQNFKEE